MSEDAAAVERSALSVIRESKALAYATGAVTLLAGIVLLLWPHRTLTVVARLSGLLLLIVGLSDVIDAVSNHRRQRYWGLLTIRGLLNVATGVALVVWPGITVGVLVWLIGLDLVLTGVLGLVIRGQAPPELRSVLLSRSVVTIAFGVAVMVWPHATVAVVAFIVGLVLTVTGLVLLWTGRQLSKLRVQVIEV